MSIASFLSSIKMKLNDTSIGDKVGGYIYKGLNKKDFFSSRGGGNWNPQYDPAYELHSGNKQYLLRITERGIAIEAIHLRSQLINFTIKNTNFKENEGKIRVLENYNMNAGKGKKSKEVVIKALEEAGMTTNVILEADSTDIDIDKIIDDIFKWADYRKKAKEIIKSNQTQIPKPIVTPEVVIQEVIPPIIPIMMSNSPLNQIFFGSPGTGKTYHTVNEALKIVGYDIEGKSRKEIKAEFDKRMANGQIVFTTFHQSMSYEDFIEGIKPEYSETKQLVEYPIKSGIFKQICYNALKDMYYANIERKEDNEVDFDFIYDAFIRDLKSKFKENDYPFKTKDGSELRFDKNELFENNRIVAYYKWSNASTQSGEGKTPFLIKKDKIQKMLEEGVSDSETNLKARLKLMLGYHISAHYAVYKSFLQFLKGNPNTNTTLTESEMETVEGESDYSKYLEQLSIIQKQKGKLSIAKPYVIIIDEINRGNISQIFGELITLLEVDKRFGNDEALNVKLPYSKEEFSVPSNVYIIGTMNTADRSVEALDTALRRRFSFVEMMPDSDLLAPNYMFWQLLWDNLGIVWDDPKYKEPEKRLLDFLGASKQIWDNRKKNWDNMFEEGKFIEQIELFPEEEFTGYNLKNILDTINNRIEILLSRDNSIGHSYFLKVDSEEALKNAFFNGIIPLLQEYFYGDYGKIGLVLGEGFIQIKNKENSAKVGFAKFDYDDTESLYKRVYELIPNDMDFNIKDAITKLLENE